jgi:adenosylcobinamide-GDP ribazoletransferase
VGALVGGAWWSASQVLPAPVAAGLAVALDLALTGLLHVDGLADSADGLLPPLERSRRLAVMRQPDVGAFGVATVVVVLGLRWAALAGLAPEAGAQRILLVAGLWTAARVAMAAVLVGVRPARPDGLAAAFAPGPGAAGRPRSVGGPVVGLAAATIAVGLGRGWVGLVALVAGLVAGAALVDLARRRLGGCTGDVLGALGLVVETTGLVVATVGA